MPDVNLWDVVAGVKLSWSANAILNGLIPNARLFQDFVPGKVDYPNAYFEIEDVSNFFGGTEYFSGAEYVKITRVTIYINGPRTTNFLAISAALAEVFGWQAGNPAGGVTVPNARVLSVVREVEKHEALHEKVNGEEIYQSSYTCQISKQANRG